MNPAEGLHGSEEDELERGNSARDGTAPEGGDESLARSHTGPPAIEQLMTVRKDGFVMTVSTGFRAH